MPLDVIYGNKWQIRSLTQPLGIRYADEERSNKPRTVGYGNATEVV